MKKILPLFLVVIFLVATSGYSQQNQTAADKEQAKTAKKAEKEKKKQAKLVKKQQKIAEGKSLVSPLVLPAYTPELGFLVSAAGLWTFKPTDKDDMKIQRSSMPIMAGVSSTGAIVGNAILTSFWFKDKLRIYGQFWYKDMPDNYWGIGYDNGYNVPKSDSTTFYQRQWFWINPTFMWQFKKNFFLGLNVDYNYTKGSRTKNQTDEQYQKGVGSDPTYIKYNDRPLNSGIGIVLQHDSRDVPVDNRTGWYINLNATFYSTAFGGDNKYQMYLADYRHAVQLSELSGQNTLAWQAKARFTFGDVPYGEMSQLGTPFDLRGYTWGRYRNEDMFFFLTEYRHVFNNKEGKLGKHGVVAWMGSGTIFDWETLKDNNNRWLPNFGVGYRLELQPRMWLRIDYGIGRQSSGIYFNFNQAF